MNISEQFGVKLVFSNFKLTEQQKMVFDNHVRIEDTHLDEAKEWEKKVENNRAKAASNWRAKMHCMQTIAEGRMADIERRKYDRKRNATARKYAKVMQGFVFYLAVYLLM